MIGFAFTPPQHADFWEVTEASGTRVVATLPTSQYSRGNGGVLIAHIPASLSYDGGVPAGTGSNGQDGSLNLGVNPGGAGPAAVVIWNTGEVIGAGGDGGVGTEQPDAGPNNVFCGGGGGGAGNPEGSGGIAKAPGNAGADGSRPSGGAGGTEVLGTDDSPQPYIDLSSDGGVALNLNFSTAAGGYDSSAKTIIIENVGGKLWGGGGGGGSGTGPGDGDGKAGGDCGDDGTANAFGDKGDGGAALVTAGATIVDLYGGTTPDLRGAIT